MKAIVSLTSLLFFQLVSLPAQFDSNYIQLGNDGSEDIVAVFPGENGDIWAAGTYSGEMVADQLYSSLGETDIWCGKWAAGGSIAAFFTIGSTRADEILECKLLENGNLFLSGYFFKSLVLPDTVIEVENAIKAVFLLEMTPDGTLVNHQLISGTGQKEIGKVTMLEEGCLLAGSFSNTLKVNNQSITASGLEDAFILELDVTWQPLTFKAFACSGRAAGRSLLQLSADSFFLSGHFSGAIQLDSLNLTTTTPDFDLFIAFLDKDFEVVAARRLGGVYDSKLYSADLYADSLLLFSGNHRGVINLDTETRIQTRGLNDNIFAFALDKSGKVRWGQSIGGASDENLQHNTLSSNAFYLAGFGQGGFEIGGEELPRGPGFSHGFLLALHPENGTTNWFSNLQGDEFVISRAVGSGPDGATYWGLSFSGALYANNTIQVSKGFYDVVFGKLRDDLSNEEPVFELPAISVFPNPFTDVVQVSNLPAGALLSVFNQQGQRMEIQRNENFISLPVCPLGLYFLKIQTKNTTQVLKLLKTY